MSKNVLWRRRKKTYILVSHIYWSISPIYSEIYFIKSKDRHFIWNNRVTHMTNLGYNLIPHHAISFLYFLHCSNSNIHFSPVPHSFKTLFLLFNYRFDCILLTGTGTTVVTSLGHPLTAADGNIYPLVHVSQYGLTFNTSVKKCVEKRKQKLYKSHLSISHRTSQTKK